MDKTNNLQHFLMDIADAIREKKGTSDLINAQNFADEIKNISQNGEDGENTGGETSVKFALEPNGWCWKLSDELIAGTGSAQSSVLNELFVLYGRIYDSVMKLSYGTVSITKSYGDRETYKTIGALGTSTDNIARVIAIREAYGAEVTIGATTYKGESLCDVYSKMTGLSEDAFLSTMAESGLTRITNEEYEELMNA